MSETGLKNITYKRDRGEIIAIQVSIQWRGRRRYGRIEVDSSADITQAIREAKMLRDDFERELRKPSTERIIRAIAAREVKGRHCLGVTVDRARGNVVVSWAPTRGAKRRKAFGYRRCGLDVAWSRALEFRQSVERQCYGGHLAGCRVKGTA